MQLLLTIMHGLKSFEDLRTHNSIVLLTFQAAAAAIGLLLHNGDWVACFIEAAVFAIGRRLRSFFVSALLNGLVTDPLAIWMAFCVHFCDNLQAPTAALNVTIEADAHLDYGLYLLDRLLAESSKSTTLFGLLPC